MLKIKNTLSFAALVCGLLICFNAPVAAQNFVPPGSYKLSCGSIKNVGADLTDLEAYCSGGKEFPPVANLRDYFECEGDIANNHSQLECNRNPNSPLMLKTRATFDAQYKAVTGLKIATHMEYKEYKYFLRMMFRNGMAPQFYEGTYGVSDLNLIRAFIQYWLDKPENISRKAEVVEQAFKDVYNFYGGNPKDLAFYNAQNIGYTDIVKAETAKLNSKPWVRHVMISAAYKKTMGRMPTAGDRAYWETRTEYFTQIVDAARAYLYSPNGANDLAETVKRALSSNMPGEPTSAQIKSAIVKYTQNKAIFDEM
jgi:hypothetical protein